MIDSILGSIRGFNHIVTLNQIMGYYAIVANEEDQACLGNKTLWKTCAHQGLLQGVKIAVNYH